MTPADTGDLATLIEQYRAGLEAELAILHRLEATAARQQAASDPPDFEALARATNERDGLMAGLVGIEGELNAVRQALSDVRERARELPGYGEAVALHHEAIALVSRIVKADKESLEALAAAELARRESARAIEQGETTLTAYRRVMTAITPGATLVDRRG